MLGGGGGSQGGLAEGFGVAAAAAGVAFSRCAVRPLYPWLSALGGNLFFRSGWRLLFCWPARAVFQCLRGPHVRTRCAGVVYDGYLSPRDV